MNEFNSNKMKINFVKFMIFNKLQKSQFIWSNSDQLKIKKKSCSKWTVLWMVLSVSLSPATAIYILVDGQLRKWTIHQS